MTQGEWRRREICVSLAVYVSRKQN